MVDKILNLKKQTVQPEDSGRLGTKLSVDNPEKSRSMIKKVGEKRVNSQLGQNPVPIMQTWIGPLYYRSPDTKLITGVIVVLVVVGVFFIFGQRDPMAAIFFLLSAPMLFIISRQSPPLVEFTVGPLSVKIGSREYKFSEIKSFWLEYNPGGIKELSLQLRKWYVPYIKIPLMDEDPMLVSVILSQFISEVEHEDSIFDSLSRLLGI